MILVSACLAGVNCRYDCGNRTDQKILELVENGQAIPVCPEQLGGLPTPRIPAEQVNDKVLDKDGNDLSKQYDLGSDEVVKLVQLCNIETAYLKNKSPMCGSGKIYDGSFTGKLKVGDGVLTKKLKKIGIKIVSIE